MCEGCCLLGVIAGRQRLFLFQYTFWIHSESTTSRLNQPTLDVIDQSMMYQPSNHPWFIQSSQGCCSFVILHSKHELTYMLIIYSFEPIPNFCRQKHQWCVPPEQRKFVDIATRKSACNEIYCQCPPHTFKRYIVLISFYCLHGDIKYN